MLICLLLFKQELHFRKIKVLVTVRHVDSYTERCILLSQSVIALSQTEPLGAQLIEHRKNVCFCVELAEWLTGCTLGK